MKKRNENVWWKKKVDSKLLLTGQRHNLLFTPTPTLILFYNIWFSLNRPPSPVWCYCGKYINRPVLIFKIWNAFSLNWECMSWNPWFMFCFHDCLFVCGYHKNVLVCFLIEADHLDDIYYIYIYINNICLHIHNIVNMSFCSG